jgi:PHD/YefM family antitoxin component YafN of YafNO toxin-antitoxin module
MKTQFVTDRRGKKLAVILPIKEYNKMVDDLEELEDIKLYDSSKEGEQEFIDADLAFKEIEEAWNKNESL